ncbi:MAG TPA: glycosyltransferase WbuB, partial [Cyanobacteria bacterium UBA11369]|nr:glycosyltransferase WbuB [Cyanobacteria bacterium UBA11369]
GDKESLKIALRKAYAKRELLPEIGRKAREEIIANYSWNARVEMMLEKIQNLHVN